MFSNASSTEGIFQRRWCDDAVKVAVASRANTTSVRLRVIGADCNCFFGGFVVTVFALALFSSATYFDTFISCLLQIYQDERLSFRRVSFRWLA